MNRKRSKDTVSGFTLVELLAVIAIIAVLAAMMIPGIENARAMARESQCRSNLRQIGLAIQSYAADNGGRFPAYNRGPWTGIVTDPHQGGRHPGRQWDAQIAPYLGMVPGTMYRQPTVFYCPSSPMIVSRRPPGQGLSYLYNRLLGHRGVREGGNNDLGGRDWFGSGSVHTLQYPDSTILTVEYHFYYYQFAAGTSSHTPSLGLDFSQPVIQYLWPQAAHVSMGAIHLGQPLPNYYRQIHFRHRERTHVLFADFHAASRERISNNPRRVGYFIPDGVRLHNEGTYHSR